MYFFLRGMLLWILDLGILARSNGLELKCLNVGFVSYKQAAFLLHRTLTDGLEWCGLFRCFYQPFTAEDPLESK